MGNKPKVAIVGAGLMGHGIAQVFMRAGHRVKVFDKSREILDKLHARIEHNLLELGEHVEGLDLISGHSNLEEAVADADVVIEAAPEKLDLKRSIFADLVQMAPAHALLASNTSVMPIGGIAEGLPTGERILGTHWWNPPFLVPLVEVIGTPSTSASSIDAMIALLRSVGKTPVHVKKDVPGFVGNRLQHALWREAVAIVAEGICDARTVDIVVKASFGRRLAVLGPIENADLIGTDLTLDIHESVLPHIDRFPEPSPYLRTLVADGRLGMKTGLGFRTWTQQEERDLRARVFLHLKLMMAADSSAPAH